MDFITFFVGVVLIVVLAIAGMRSKTYKALFYTISGALFVVVAILLMSRNF